jgi:hypothetical protein
MIDLGFRKKHLYAARRLTAQFVDSTSGACHARGGTGFVVSAEVGAPSMLVTNRHVVDAGYADPRCVAWVLQSLEVVGYETVDGVEEEQVLVARNLGEVRLHDECDVAVIPLTGAELRSGPGTFHRWYPADMLARSADLDQEFDPGDLLIISGYVDVESLDMRRPVASAGVLSSDPRHPLTVGRSQRAVLYQALSRAGMSGAPVLAVQRGLHLGAGLDGPPVREAMLVGVNAGHLSDSPERGWSYFIRSDAIHDLL